MVVFRWGLRLSIVTLATALATLIFSYLYLRLKPPQWPPAGIAMPDPVLPATALAADGNLFFHTLDSLDNSRFDASETNGPHS